MLHGAPYILFMFKTNSPTFRAFTVVGSAAFGAVHAGEKNFDFAMPSAKQMLSIGTANSTNTTGVLVVMNNTNFGTVVVTPPQLPGLTKSSTV